MMLILIQMVMLMTKMAADDGHHTTSQAYQSRVLPLITTT
jgi:hypothetical protein